MSRRPRAKDTPALAAHHKQRLTIADFTSGRAQEVLSHRWGPNLLDNAERKMAAILETAGLPTAAGVVFQTKHSQRNPRGRGRVTVTHHHVGLDKLAAHRGYSIGSEIWYAARIVEQVAGVRHAIASGNPDHLLHETLHLGALMKEASIVVPGGDIFDLGLVMHAGRKPPRRDVLAYLIDEALARLGADATAEAALDYIRATGKVEVDDFDKSIAWTNKRGGDETTTFKAFQNRLPLARKRACTIAPPK